MKVVDKFTTSNISAFVTAGRILILIAHFFLSLTNVDIKLMLLHDKIAEDSIKNFFAEVYELYLKVILCLFSSKFKILLNPFYTVNTPIVSSQFDEKVKGIAKKKLDL